MAQVPAAQAKRISLVDRAVHPYFLLQAQAVQTDVPGKGRVQVGELTVGEVVFLYVKQATETACCDYVQAIHRLYVRNSWSREGKFRHDLESSAATLNMERLCKDKPINGPTTYFLSHCWAYKFKDLVSLVMRHYDAQPGTSGGLVYQPLYYWVDIFAVFQNFKGDFKDHPDSDFPGVIRASQGVLFTIMPWRAPLCVERVWCLFEALQAVSSHVGLDLLVEDVQSGQSLDKLQQLFTKVVVDNLDIRKCKATVEADKTYILAQIEKSLSIDRFNQIMKGALDKQVKQVMLITAVQQNDSDNASKLIKSGVVVMSRVLSFSGCTAFDGNDKGLKALTDAIKVSHAVQALTFNTTGSCKVSQEGLCALMSALKSNRSITDLTISKGPKENLKLHEGGWMSVKSVSALGDALSANVSLRRLDLSRQIKLASAGITALAKGLMNADASCLAELILCEVATDGKGAAMIADAITMGALPSVSANSTVASFGTVGSVLDRGAGSSSQASFSGGTPLQQRLMRASGAASGSSMTMSGGSPFSTGSFTGMRRPTAVDLLGTDRAGMSTTPASPSGGAASSTRPRLPMQRLDLSLNPIGDGEGPVALGKMLSKAPVLQQLDLRNCELGSSGARALASGLADAPSMTHLDLSGNKIGDDGATAIAQALRKSRVLKVLKLGSCDIRTLGATAIGTALPISTAPLMELAINNNIGIGNSGAAAIGQGIRAQGKGSFMRRLFLSHCGIVGKEGIAGVAAGLWGNRSLQEVDLEGNGIKQEEAAECSKVLADALKGNSTLAKLVLTGCLNPVALSSLLEKLQEGCKQLEVVK